MNICRILPLAAILLLTYPNHAAAEQNKQGPSDATAGRGSGTIVQERLKQIRMDAEQGNPVSQRGLGTIHANGFGVPQDYAEAAKWYRKAADQGDAGAQSSLGAMYANGRGVPQDYAEAVKWHLKAADQGDAVSQVFVGSMYANGNGIQQDYIQSYMWLTLSIAGSTGQITPTIQIDGITAQPASELRDSVALKMTRQHAEEAERLVKEWESAYVQKMGDGPFVFGWGVTPPANLVAPTPRYTEQARKARINGYVQIQCIVRKNGNANSCKILKGLGYGLDELAINTIETIWRFKPGTFQGNPVDFKDVMIEFNFMMY